MQLLRRDLATPRDHPAAIEAWLKDSHEVGVTTAEALHSLNAWLKAADKAGVTAAEALESFAAAAQHRESASWPTDCPTCGADMLDVTKMADARKSFICFSCPPAALSNLRVLWSVDDECPACQKLALMVADGNRGRGARYRHCRACGRHWEAGAATGATIPLGRRCPHCGAVCEAAARFCGDCGATL